MDYRLYENSDILLNDNSDSSKNSWNIPNECSMDNNGDIFGWNSLKIDEGEGKTSRKRRISFGEEERKVKGGYKLAKDPLSLDGKGAGKKSGGHKGSVKIQHWEVEDYEDLNTDIESSLSLGGNDLVNNSYAVNENMLSMNGMTVFKQEAPSPTSNDVTTLQVTHKHRQSPSSTHHGGAVVNSTMEDNTSQNMFNSTINQLLTQSGLVGLHNVMDANNLSSQNSADSYTVSSTNYNLIEDSRFQYVLAAATSIATKQNEDTLTYLNQGQSYEIKLKKLGELSFYRGKLFRSVVRICFHERRLQYMEKEQMLSWQKARPGDRILEIDVPLSYGAYDIYQPSNALNVIQFNWDPTKEVGVYIKVNCISTEFTPKKHGGEKGVPFRIQVETYQHPDLGVNGNKRLHAAACQIKVFKLKGADRKHKQDREKIMKRPMSEQEKYQPSYDCTVLNDLPSDAVLSTPPMTPDDVESNSDSNPQIQNLLPPRAVDDGTNNGVISIAGPQAPVQNTPLDNEEKPQQTVQTKTLNSNLNLTQESSPEETSRWLTANRFEKYADTFGRFSGDDMLRMSRDDLIQICGDADGIRLHNSIHLKSIAPKLKIYVCRDNSSLYNAIFLSAHSKTELAQKLSAMLGLPRDQIRDVYVEGPHSIHVQLNDDVLKHIKEETMFALEVMQQDNNGYVLLLKRSGK
ncbi:transcription factor CP2 like gemini isoform X1 [Leptinotarsa decemlineata]|uniref:transcription factor CP2 like gemini isoform X1 n=2 Tax=Leptinotarsa decemlineata TaxID=7539 RepID=UPI003D306F25